MVLSGLEEEICLRLGSDLMGLLNPGRYPVARI
jgi:hypothetical protein